MRVIFYTHYPLIMKSKILNEKFLAGLSEGEKTLAEEIVLVRRKNTPLYGY